MLIAAKKTSTMIVMADSSNDFRPIFLHTGVWDDLSSETLRCMYIALDLPASSNITRSERRKDSGF